ncbi:MAG: hypothetical protein HY342_11805 [Candidatus Lambdaproteobacteria bacterium]|nr:hypothetical protein [Candidatus Lambdaproteobacteria bacterium]
MLEIDYGLIPLSKEDQASIGRAVRARLLQGQAPALDRSQGGRVVVVNPDSILQPQHQIPDHLRTQLRRVVLLAVEGSTVIRAPRLIERILASDEPLFAVIVELYADFAEFPAFLDGLLQVQAAYPAAPIYFSGPREKVVSHLQRLLGEGGRQLGFVYDDPRGTISVTTSEELPLEFKGPPELNERTLDEPFFQKIRIRLDGQEAPVVCTPASLRRLHPVFGCEPVYREESAGARREAVHVIELPLEAILDVQLPSAPARDFHGILTGERTILARNFAKLGLDTRAMRLNELKGIVQRTPGDPARAIMLAGIKSLRINCQSGRITFMRRRKDGEITFSDLRALRIVDTAPPAGNGEGRAGDRASGAGASAPPAAARGPAATAAALPAPAGAVAPASSAAAAEGQAPVPRVLAIEGVMLPPPEGLRITPLHLALQNAYFGYWIRRHAEQNRKLELFAGRMTVASVGPMAGQTVKLLRRFALERFIERDAFHYLCDTPQSMLAYDRTAQRFQEHFHALLTQLREIARVKGTQGLRLDDITHSLPVVSEWMDTPGLALAQVSPEALNAAYMELKTLVQFIGHEFQRNFDNVGEGDAAFFRKMQSCIEAGMVAKWLADFKRGAYGPTIPAGKRPDFVFFATAADRAQNDAEYFFPSLACADLFAQPENQRLFERMDYRFAVFLEEQLALADHYAREQGSRGHDPAAILPYFDQQRARAKAEADTLAGEVAAIDNEGSPAFLAIEKQEREAYRARYAQFVSDRQALIGQYETATDQMLEHVRGVLPSIVLPAEPHRQWLEPDGEQTENLLDSELCGFAERALEAETRKFERAAGIATQRVVETAERLGDLEEALRRTQQAHRYWQQLRQQNQLAVIAGRTPPNLEQRVAGLKRQDAAALMSYLRRLDSQAATAQGEHEQLVQRLERLNNAQAIGSTTFASGVARVRKRYATLAAETAQGAPEAVFKRIQEAAAKLAEVIRSFDGTVSKARQDMDNLEKLLLSQQRVVGGLHNLRLERAHVVALQARAKVEPPPFPLSLANQDAQAAESAQSRYHEQVDVLTALQEQLKAFGPDLPALRQARRDLKRCSEVRERGETLRRLAARKRRLRASARALAERQAIMEAELADLPRRIRERFMPARKELLLNVFIPESRRMLASYQDAKGLLAELMQLSPQRLQGIYLNRAVYRRFLSRQFVRGYCVPLDPRSPGARALPNVQPAIAEFYRLLHFNFSQSHPELTERMHLDYAKQPLDAAALGAWIDERAGTALGTVHDYVILPPTLSLREAVGLIARKDAAFRGVPRMVLIYVSKFRASLLYDDPALREAYFHALKHNVIVNVDGNAVVDNPGAIAWRLLNETAGATVDTEAVQEAPRESSSAE